MPTSDPNTPFVIPPRYHLLDSDSILDDENFDWDTIKNNPNLELWLIRMPNNLAARHIESVTLTPSSSLHPSKLGELTRKETTYEFWSQNPSQSNVDDEALQQPICGEEMKSMTCLLPRRSKGGELFAAPKPFTRHIIITAKPNQPQSVTDPDSSAGTAYPNPPRQSYPPNLLQHRFRPYGSLAPIDSAEQDNEHRKLGTSKPKYKNKTTNQRATSPSVTIVGMDTVPAGKGAKNMQEEQEEQNSPAVDASPLVDNTSNPIKLSSDEGGKLSKSKKRKGDKERNDGVKKSRKLNTKGS